MPSTYASFIVQVMALWMKLLKVARNLLRRKFPGCPSFVPFSERKNFQRAISGFDDPSRHSLRSFFQQLSKENGALLIIGDSVMQQFFSAMACELEREGIWKDPGRFTNTDELQYVRVDKNTSAVQIKFLPIYHFVNGRYERIPHAAMHSLKNTLKLMTTEFQSLVVICNMGLHYVDNPVSGFSRRDYQLQMTAALTYMNKFALQHPQKNVRIFWRETSAQHFPTTNGYWPGVKYSNTLRLACVPLADPSPAADWRNRDIENIIISNNLFMIRIIPFYNVTIPLWSEHPNGHLKDCTHFCWSPMLYQSVFYEMNRGMEQLWIKSA
eukprot:CAMPEP_0174977042 /NCGR_PEP_ID=MMETSP0004_2-20121128/13379_1 /TAXON_ID=420556 /ORGANISM="Ochromonas sp., Strain CCMP1393" /LENGTH=324 /DNA_ID=CAMNT_0016228161 /DNA_START=85 /DNA_END=1059 /DNA_ORIENTATION=+